MLLPSIWAALRSCCHTPATQWQLQPRSPKPTAVVLLLHRRDLLTSLSTHPVQHTTTEEAAEPFRLSAIRKQGGPAGANADCWTWRAKISGIYQFMCKVNSAQRVGLCMSHRDVQLCPLNVVTFGYHDVELNYGFIVYWLLWCGNYACAYSCPMLNVK